MEKQVVNTLHHCVYNLQYHLVLVTKYRRKVISGKILDQLRDTFSRLLTQWECELVEFNGEQDHVHLLISVHPKVALSILVNNLKTVSSRLIRRDFSGELARVYRKPGFWSRSYCILSCGGAPLSVLKRYIENQAEID